MSTTSTIALVPSAPVHATSERSYNHKPVAAIAGGVVGGIVLIILIVAAAFMYRWRRHGGVDKITNVRRGGAQEPVTQIDPVGDPSIGQPSVYVSLSRTLKQASATTLAFLHATKTPGDGLLAPTGTLYVNGASSWELPEDTPGAPRDALLPPSLSGAPIPPAIHSLTNRPSSAAHAQCPSEMPQPQSSRTFRRREESSRQMRNIENAAADLRRHQSAPSAQTASSRVSPFPNRTPGAEGVDAAMKRQIEALQVEVERLRVEHDLLLRAPPPAYEQEEVDQ